MLQNKMEMNRKQLRVLSHTLKLYHFTVWLMCSVVLSVEAECPSNCTRINSSLVCTDYEEITLPFEVPKWTRELTLNKKNMTVLISRAFSANGTDVYLHELSLKDNNIQVIESCAFCGLPRLQTLDLSRNRLKNVSSEAFYGLENLLFLYLNNTLTTPVVSALPRALYSLGELDKLHLSGNYLKSIPLLDFGNLNELILTNNSIATLNETDLTHLKTHNVTSIFLKDNPFKCTCDENKFYVWLQNGSQCKDKNDLKCSQPKEKEGKSVLDKDNCKKAQDLRSFVLLGIVLALIGVVFLMVLYLNRRGIKRWLNNIREACRDQMEVYHYRYEQDSDPRLANVAV